MNRSSKWGNKSEVIGDIVVCFEATFGGWKNSRCELYGTLMLVLKHFQRNIMRFSNKLHDLSLYNCVIELVAF